MLANPTTYPLMNAVTDNAALKYDVAPNLYPLAGSRSGDIQYVCLSKTFADTLNAWQDPRLPLFFQPTSQSVTAGSPKYAGVPNGQPDASLSGALIPHILSNRSHVL